MFATTVRIDSSEAWRAPVAGFIEEFLVVGYNLSSGLLLLALHQDFELRSELLLPTILIGTGLQFLLSPGIEWISSYLGYKATLLVAAILAPTSFFVLFFIPVTGASVVVFLGITLGIGRAFSKITVFKVTMIAFNRRRGAASSFLKAGASIATICFPPLFAFLLDVYGSRTTVLLTGGIFLHMLVAVVLIPSIIIDEETCMRVTPAPKLRYIRRFSEPQVARKDSSPLPSILAKQPLPVRLPFLVGVIFALWLCQCSMILSMSLFTLFADEVGLSKISIATAISVRSGVDFGTRLVNGVVFDRLEKCGKLVVMAISQILGVLFTGLLLFLTLNTDAVTAFFAYAVGLALINAFTTTGWMQIVAIFAEKYFVGRVLSMVMLSVGLTVLIKAIACHKVFLILSSYRYFYVLVGVCHLMSGIGFVILALISSKCRPSPEQEKVNIELVRK